MEQNNRLQRNNNNNIRRISREVSLDIIAEISIKEMKIEKYSKKTEIIGDKMCAIDLADFVEGDDIILTPCKHGFHPGCLKEWLESPSDPDKVCPCCKTSLKEFSIRLV